MAVKQDAQQILSRRLKDKEAEQDEKGEALAKRIAKQRRTLRHLFTGERISAEDGRELFWELIAHADVLRKDPMTGNARTYFNLGEREWPERLLDIAKEVSFDLYQKMEREARSRKESGGNE